MSNSVLKKDLKELVNSTKIEQRYDPGHGRRFEPTGGTKKHNERIHKETKATKENKNLPFSFRKPPKPIGRGVVIECSECGHVFGGTDKTVCFVCSGCGKFIRV